MTQSSRIPEFVEEPQEYLLKMDQALPMPLGLEYVVSVEVEGMKFEACIPAAMVVNKNPPVVSGMFVGTRGESKVIVFPPSSLGTSIWHIPENMLQAIRSAE